MGAGARRLTLRFRHRCARRALPLLRVWRAFPGAGVALALLTGAAGATDLAAIVGARYGEPTSRYEHGVFGDTQEWGALVLTLAQCSDCAASPKRVMTIRLPENRVFEDNMPRLFIGNEGSALVMAVESDLKLGARLAVYNAQGLLAATPFIGRPQRWLAPIGAADLDGDGFVELAYIDRPHLAKILRIWRLGPLGLREVTSLEGVTNHQFGWPDIPGGIRDCEGGPEMVVASADWRQVLAVRLVSGQLRARQIGAYSGPDSLDAALKCAE